MIVATPGKVRVHSVLPYRNTTLCCMRHVLSRLQSTGQQ